MHIQKECSTVAEHTDRIRNMAWPSVVPCGNPFSGESHSDVQFTTCTLAKLKINVFLITCCIYGVYTHVKQSRGRVHLRVETSATVPNRSQRINAYQKTPGKAITATPQTRVPNTFVHAITNRSMLMVKNQCPLQIQVDSSRHTVQTAFACIIEYIGKTEYTRRIRAARTRKYMQKQSQQIIKQYTWPNMHPEMAIHKFTTCLPTKNGGPGHISRRKNSPPDWLRVDKTAHLEQTRRTKLLIHRGTCLMDEHIV